MDFTLFDYFTDPVLRAPTIGSMLMGLAAGLIGVVVYLRKESLLGETLSHAAFPGAIAGIFVASFLGFTEDITTLFMLLGAGITAFASIYLVNWLQVKVRVPSDAALCFVLAATFGVGITAASQMQFTHAAEYRRMLSLLYGQTATMTDFHIALYGILATSIIVILALLHKEVKIVAFDRNYAFSLGIPVKAIESIFFFLVVLAVIIGIRTVGVVLMSAMLIAPAVSARQFTNRLSTVFLLAGLFGICAGFIGNYLSLTLTHSFSSATTRVSIPTGPTIVLTAATLCLFALICAPERGLASRAWRIMLFRYRCLCENILKCIWRLSPEDGTLTQELVKYFNTSPSLVRLALHSLKRQGWIQNISHQVWRLTPDGKIKAEKIVRLHRLWEVYLADYLGVGAEKVHRNAEEMEHIITPELEEALTKLLKDPKTDPHHQPIPSKNPVL